MQNKKDFKLVKSSETGAVKLYEDRNGWYELHLMYEKFDFLVNDEALILFKEYETLEKQILESEKMLKSKKEMDYKLANGICIMRQRLRGTFKSEYNDLYLSDVAWEIKNPSWMQGASSKERKEEWNKHIVYKELKKRLKNVDDAGEEILCYECNNWVDIEEAYNEKTNMLICPKCNNVIDI